GGAEALHRAAPHGPRRLQIRDRRRAPRPRGVDDPDDARPGVDRGVAARTYEHGAEVERVDDHAAESRKLRGYAGGLLVFEDGRRSLLFVEPPDHTRIRKLVAAAFTPRAVEAMRAPAQELAHSLLDACLERRRFGLLYDFAQPYSITLICRLLGVPTDRHRDLLDWSHRHVKMYEFDTTEEQAQSATRAAAEFRDYVLELIEERRRAPRDDMVSALGGARVDGGRLSDDEIVSTVVVLLNAGHEATVNTLGNGVRALLR